MAEFEVRTDGLNDVANNFERISKQVSGISQDARRILSNTRGSITAKISYALQRGVVCGNIDNCSVDYKIIAKALRQVSSKYSECEKRVEGKDLFDGISWDIFSNVLDWLRPHVFNPNDIFPKGLIPGAGIGINGMTMPYQWWKDRPFISDVIADIVKPWWQKPPYSGLIGAGLIKDVFNNGGITFPQPDLPWGVPYMLKLEDLKKLPEGVGFEVFVEHAGIGFATMGASSSALFKGFRDLGSFENAISTLFKDGKIGGSLLESSVYANGEIFGIGFGGSAEGDILGASVSTDLKSGWDITKGYVGVEGSLGVDVHAVSGRVKANIGDLSTEAGVEVGSASAKGEIGATLFKDGKFAPSIGVEGKAEASVLKGDVGVQYGSETHNAHADAKGKLLGAEAEASFKAGVITETKDGVTKTKFGAKGEVGAEAYLAQGEVKGGFTIFGIDFDVSVEGKLGGAGASAGGEVTSGGVGASLDLGFGAGAGVNFSIDWSDADFSAISDFAGDVSDAVGDGIEAIGDFFGF